MTGTDGTETAGDFGALLRNRLAERAASFDAADPGLTPFFVLDTSSLMSGAEVEIRVAS